MKPVFTGEQKEVLAITQGTHLVLAPPGSGKTELLAARIEKGVRDGYREDEMICLTFTNRAARGMKERIRARLPYNKIIIGNLHHYAARFLYSNKLISPSTAVLDEVDTEQLLDEAKKDAGYPRKGEKAAATSVLLQVNNYYKQQKMGFPENLLVEPDFENIKSVDLIKIVCRRYEELKEESDVIDFDDMLSLTYKSLTDKQEGWQYCNFRWMQVDEVQDMNPIQWFIVKSIASEDCLSVYFGDYEQAIFSFMGAKLESLHKIEKECRLDVKNGIHNFQANFRSPSYLLDILVEYAEKRLKPRWKKPPVSMVKEEKKPGYLKMISIDGEWPQEAKYIVSKLLPELEKDNSRTAIIVRYNQSADILSDEMKIKEIEHFKISGFDLFKRKTVKGLMSFLSVFNDKFDRMAWARLFFIFGKIKTLKEARHLTNDIFKLRLLPTDFLGTNNDVSEDFGDNNKAIKRFKVNFEGLYTDIISKFGENISLEDISKQYFNYLVKNEIVPAKEIDKWEIAEIDKLFRHMKKISADDGLIMLKERIDRYVPDYKTYNEADLATGDEKIYLSTVYKAKGLEFDNVIVAEAVTDVYPSWASKHPRKKMKTQEHYMSHCPVHVNVYILPVIPNQSIRMAGYFQESLLPSLIV
jgi:superfamily I DNA/RNA helicase